MKQVVTVVVCTYNRAHLLRSCLESLSAQTLDQGQFEVLVVDNNSTDTTSQVVNEYTAKYSHFVAVAERQQGLSYARNRGWKEAHGEFVAYIDDDAKAHTDWLAQMSDFIERHPDVMVFGGPFDAFPETELPDWFPPEYGSWSLGDQERPVMIGEEFINGTNMVFHKSLLESLGGFKSSLGMSGEQISYGEETRLQVDIAARGLPVYYLPGMRVDHLVPKYKTNLKWLLSSAFASGRCSAETLNRQRTFGAHLYGLFIGVAKMVMLLLTSGKVPFKRTLYYSLRGLCGELGACAGYLSPRQKRRG